LVAAAMALFKISGELGMRRWVEMVRGRGFEPLTPTVYSKVLQ
jgi:hypothetical protein